MMNNRLQALKYIAADFIASAGAWAILHAVRKMYLEPLKFGYSIPVAFDSKFFLGMVGTSLFWVAIYALSGYYRNPYRKSRLKELGQTLLSSLGGVTLIFFFILLDDVIPSYRGYYLLFLTLFSAHFILTFLFRFILTTRTAHRIHNREIGFNTLIIGSNENALRLFHELEGMKKSSGFKILGFAHLNGNHDHALSPHLSHFGSVKNVRQIITDNQIEEAIIAIETNEHESIRTILNDLKGLNVNVKIIPGMYEILTGQVKMTAIFGAPLVEVNQGGMPDWQLSMKRAMDIVVSLIALVVLSPVYLSLAIIVRATSRGPVIFYQERIGRNGKPFNIYKFRSMYVDAEKSGPALSSEHDPRITRIGKFLRKSRLDELPQFFNVLIGEMSMVGPRPERQFFIDQIVQRAPHYNYLHKVRPGITSWGQVKYGYAENVDQMIDRLKFDIIYIENMSLFVDIKIMIYTVLIVLQGRGK